MIQQVIEITTFTYSLKHQDEDSFPQHIDIVYEHIRTSINIIYDNTILESLNNNSTCMYIHSYHVYRVTVKPLVLLVYMYIHVPVHIHVCIYTCDNWGAPFWLLAA